MDLKVVGSSSSMIVYFLTYIPVVYTLNIQTTSEQAGDLNTTSPQRRCNVESALSR